MARKSIHQPEQVILARLLKDMRIAAGLTQAACAEALGRPQSYLSDVEAGTRRLDLIQLRDYCTICNVSLTTFVKRFEREIG
jgi:transcriptional regulator with XRE-family HTH domain